MEMAGGDHHIRSRIPERKSSAVSGRRRRSSIHPARSIMRDPYTVLGVTRSASEKEIKSAYRSLAKRFHPDSNKGEKSAADSITPIWYQRPGTAWQKVWIAVSGAGA